jgi:hypothetical protein
VGSRAPARSDASASSAEIVTSPSRGDGTSCLLLHAMSAAAIGSAETQARTFIEILLSRAIRFYVVRSHAQRRNVVVTFR